MSLWMPGAVQRPQPGGVTLDTSLPPRGVWHITWDQLHPDGTQPEFSAVANYLIGQQYCPHIMWNPFTGYMEQYYPADVGGRALMYNNQDGAACVQVEVFFTPGCVVGGVKYDTVADTPLVGWEDLIGWMETLGIPRVWPMGAPQWTGNSRDPDVWNGNAGHYGHCHSPGDTHTDPGPMPGFGSAGTISVQSATTTPVEQDWLSMATRDEVKQAAYEGCLDALNWAIDTDDGKKLSVFGMVGAVLPRLNKLPDDIVHKPVDWYGFDGKVPAAGRKTTTLAIAAGWQDAALNGIPAAVLNQSFSLPDGTVTNLAGILTAIHAAPVVAGSAAAPAAPSIVSGSILDALNKTPIK